MLLPGLQTKYNNLTPKQRDLIHLLVFHRKVNDRYLEYTLWTMINSNVTSFWRYEKFTNKELEEGLRFLKDIGFWLSKNVIDEETYAVLFDFVMQDTHFRENIDNALGWGQLENDYEGSEHRMMRNCYYFLYKKEWESFDKANKDLAINLKNTIIGIWMKWATFQPTFLLLLSLPDKYAYGIWRKLCFQTELPNEKQFLMMEDYLMQVPEAAKNDTILSVMCEGHYFRGDEAKMNVYLVQISNESWHKHAKTAWILMSKGEYRQAIERFELSITAYRKETKTKKYYFRDLNAIFYHLCIFKLKIMSKMPEIAAFIEKIPLESPYYVTFQHQNALIYFLLNKKNNATDLLNKFDLKGVIATWSYFWVCCIIGEKYLKNVNMLKDYIDIALQQNNNVWAYEMMIIWQTLAPSNFTYNARLERLKEELDYIPLTSSEKLVNNAWEAALNALEITFLQLGAKTASEKSMRLVWLVDFQNDELQPIEQTLNKNGTWSSGKAIALKRLKESPPAYLEQQDYRVIRYLQEASANYYYSTKSSWEWNVDKAFEELAGHPLLFLKNSPTVSVELIKEEVQLKIEEIKGKYEVALSVNLNIKNVGSIVIKETPTRYKLYVISQTHLQFVQAIGGGKVLIPKEAKERLAKITTSLSSKITIHSDLVETNQNMPTMEADARMYVHLLPVGEGFSLEMFSKPFQTLPPYFSPGKGGENVIAEIKGVKTKTQRKLKQEKENFAFVEKSCPTLATNATGNGVWLLEDSKECLDVLVELDALRKEEKIIIEWPKGEKLRLAQRVDFHNFSFGITKKQDWFEVSGELTLDSGVVMSMQALLDLVKTSNNEYVQLADGQYLALTKAFQKKLKEISEVVNDKGKKGLQVHPLSALMLDDFTSNLTNIKTDKGWKEQIEKIKSSRKISPKLSSHFTAELRSYQKDGYIWLHQLAHWGVGACLADDMGLGKTVQALAVIQDRAKKGPTLVVAPVSVCRNWEKEAIKFATSLTPILFQGTSSERKEIIEQLGPFDLLITSYGLLQQEIELLATRNFTTIVLDEAQAIKNHQTKRAKAALDLQGEFKMITTGTPIENHLGELWSLFSFINPGFLGSLQTFQDRFATPIEKYGNKEKKQILKKLITPFILRRKKNEVLDDLPPKTEITLTVQLSDEEKAFYEALRQNALKVLENKDTNDIRFQILAEITRLRRACCNPQLVSPGISIESSKLKLFDEVVGELLENGHRALVFSQYVGHLEIIKQHLDNKGIEYQYLDGSTTANKRQEAVEDFQSGKGDLFLISLKAGGTGLNLTSADFVIHMDPWWNPAVEDQASDRAHRIGQKRPVTVYRLVTENTIEEKILALHHDKRDLADSLLEGTDNSHALSTEDLLNLLKV